VGPPSGDPTAAEGLGRKAAALREIRLSCLRGRGTGKHRERPLARERLAAHKNPDRGRGAGHREAHPARALATLPPRFSAERMLADVGTLAAPELARARVGPATGSTAAPGSSPPPSPPPVCIRPVTSRELLPGIQGRRRRRSDHGHAEERRRDAPRKPYRSRQGPARDRAHYEPLGGGRPRLAPRQPRPACTPEPTTTRAGVAVLLELARTLWKERAAGSHRRLRAFPARNGDVSARRTSSVGTPSGRDGRLRWSISTPWAGSRGARSWCSAVLRRRSGCHIFRGAGYLAGVETATAADLDASDDVTWRRAGVPAVQIFARGRASTTTGQPTHRQIDGAGLVKVAALTAESSTISPARRRADRRRRQAGAINHWGRRERAQGQSRRRADFSFSGAGVRLEGVVPGSPAEAAGCGAATCCSRSTGSNSRPQGALGAAEVARTGEGRVAICQRRRETDVETSLVPR